MSISAANPAGLPHVSLCIVGLANESAPSCNGGGESRRRERQDAQRLGTAPSALPPERHPRRSVRADHRQRRLRRHVPSAWLAAQGNVGGSIAAHWPEVGSRELRGISPEVLTSDQRIALRKNNVNFAVAMQGDTAHVGAEVGIAVNGRCI